MLVERGLYGSRRASADAHVRACTNPGRTEYFSPSELLAIMAFTGRFEWLQFQCRVLGLCEPIVADPTELLRVKREELERHRTLSAQIEAEVRELEGDPGCNEPCSPRWNPPVWAKFRRARGN